MEGDKILRLQDFGVSPDRGYLPNEDPLTVLPSKLDFLDDFGNNLPEHIESKQILARARFLPIPPLEYFSLLNNQELQLAWVRYVFIQSAYVHLQKNTSASISICPSLARSVWAISKLLNKPPILSYDAYVLNNWRRKNPAGDICVDNLQLIQTFIRDSDQSWFNLIHVDIEYEAGLGIHNLWNAVSLAELRDSVGLEQAIFGIEQSIKKMIATMKRMPEGTRPDTYYKIRPWIMPFKNVTYEGVDEPFWDQSKPLRGQTGAQTSIFQSFEAGLQMPKLEATNELAVHLMDMRNYMPENHRKFIEYLEANSKVRDSIISWAPHLIGRYDNVVYQELTFLSIHLGYAFYYIHKQTDNPKGTGDTPDFMEYLGGRIKERWQRAFIRPRSDDDFKLFMTDVRKMVRELVGV